MKSFYPSRWVFLVKTKGQKADELQKNVFVLFPLISGQVFRKLGHGGVELRFPLRRFQQFLHPFLKRQRFSSPGRRLENQLRNSQLSAIEPDSCARFAAIHLHGCVATGDGPFLHDGETTRTLYFSLGIGTEFVARFCLERLGIMNSPVADNVQMRTGDKHSSAFGASPNDGPFVFQPG